MIALFLEMEELADHGITLPPNMQGLTDEQIEELKLKDEWAERCQPSGGHTQKKDKIGRRNGIGKTSSCHLIHHKSLLTGSLAYLYSSSLTTTTTTILQPFV